MCKSMRCCQKTGRLAAFGVMLPGNFSTTLCSEAFNEFQMLVSNDSTYKHYRELLLEHDAIMAGIQGGTTTHGQELNLLKELDHQMQVARSYLFNLAQEWLSKVPAIIKGLLAEECHAEIGITDTMVKTMEEHNRAAYHDDRGHESRGQGSMRHEEQPVGAGAR